MRRRIVLGDSIPPASRAPGPRILADTSAWVELDRATGSAHRTAGCPTSAVQRPRWPCTAPATPSWPWGQQTERREQALVARWQAFADCEFRRQLVHQTPATALPAVLQFSVDLAGLGGRVVCAIEQPAWYQSKIADRGSGRPRAWRRAAQPSPLPVRSTPRAPRLTSPGPIGVVREPRQERNGRPNPAATRRSYVRRHGPPDIPAAKRAGLPVDLDRLAAEGDGWLTADDRYALKTQGVCAQLQPGRLHGPRPGARRRAPHRPGPGRRPAGPQHRPGLDPPHHPPEPGAALGRGPQGARPCSTRSARSGSPPARPAATPSATSCAPRTPASASTSPSTASPTPGRSATPSSPARPSSTACCPAGSTWPSAARPAAGRTPG